MVSKIVKAAKILVPVAGAVGSKFFIKVKDYETWPEEDIIVTPAPDSDDDQEVDLGKREDWLLDLET